MMFVGWRKSWILPVGKKIRQINGKSWLICFSFDRSSSKTIFKIECCVSIFSLSFSLSHSVNSRFLCCFIHWTQDKTENNLNASNDRILIQIRNTTNQFESSGITKINSSETWIIETISFRTAHWVRWTVQCDRFVYAKRAASRMFDSIFHYFTTVQFESKELKKLLLSIIEYEYSRNMNDHSIRIGTNFSK